MTIWRTLRSCPSDTTRCSRFCLTLFSWPEEVLTAYQRNIFPLQNCLDQLGEDLIDGAQVDAGDHYEEEDDARELGQRPAVGPLNSLQLRPARLEEVENSTATPLCRPGGRLAAHSARSAGPGPHLLELVLEDLALVE